MEYPILGATPDTFTITVRASGDIYQVGMPYQGTDGKWYIVIGIEEKNGEIELTLQARP